jgi:hypothetical protein
MQAGAAAMRLGKALLASIEARTALLYGLRKPQTDVISAETATITCTQ